MRETYEDLENEARNEHFLRNKLEQGKLTLSEFFKIKPKQMDLRELTYGERAVGISFNPSKNPEVESLKQDFAHIIDHMSDLRDVTKDSEVKRLASVAITEAQGACMWAVKAITWSN